MLGPLCLLNCLLKDVHKENMFTLNLEDGREAPSKASIVYSQCVSTVTTKSDYLIYEKFLLSF